MVQNSSNPNYDLIVIGGGIMGTSTAFYASQKSKRILVIDRFDYFLPDSNRLKSNSVGATRQFRIQYSEDYMAKLAMQSIDHWAELQTHTSEELVSKVGSLWFGDPTIDSSEGQIKRAMKVMDELEIPYTKLTSKQIEERYKFADLPENWIGFFQKDGGTIDVSATFEVLYENARRTGHVHFSPYTKVLHVITHTDRVVVITDKGHFTAPKIVIAAGPYTNDITKSFNLELDMNIWQMVSCYFKKKHPDVNYPSWFAFGPPKEWYDPGLYYGFEEVDYSNPGYIRVAPAFARHQMRHPDDRTERPDLLDLERTSNWVRRHMPGLHPELRYKSSCMAALPSDGTKKMFLGFAPLEVANNRIVIFSSGWAFKYVPIIGLACAQLALEGETEFDISKFSIPPGDAPESLLSLKEATKKSTRRLPF